MENDISLEMETLMYNFWVIKEENPELYHIIKKNQNKIKNFLGKNVGSNLIIHDKFIKLEKVPTVPNENTGIPSFTNILDYCILLILLIFLEDKTKGDKFILSDLIEYIKDVNWHLVTHFFFASGSHCARYSILFLVLVLVFNRFFPSLPG